jgi:hypothetical protein
VVTDDRLIVFVRQVTEEPASDVADQSSPDNSDQVDFELFTIDEQGGDGSQMDEIRPFFTEEGLHIAARFHDASEQGIVRAGVLNLESGSGKLSLLGPRAGNFRQGWSPFVTADGPHFVAWWEPTEVFRLDEQTGNFDRLRLRMAPHIAERFQGGSQGVPVPGGYLFLVNETVRFDDGSKATYARFARIDEEFQITDISPQFFVVERGKDVATGLARQGDRLIAGFTSGETSAVLSTIELDVAIRSLMPVDAPGRGRS